MQKSQCTLQCTNYMLLGCFSCHDRRLRYGYLDHWGEGVAVAVFFASSFWWNAKLKYLIYSPYWWLR